MCSDARGLGSVQEIRAGYSAYYIGHIPWGRAETVAASLHVTLGVDHVTPQRDERAPAESVEPGTLVACGERAPTPSGCVARILRPPSRCDHKGAMTPHVIATSLAMEGLERRWYGMARRAISVVAGVGFEPTTFGL